MTQPGHPKTIRDMSTRICFTDVRSCGLPSAQTAVARPGHRPASGHPIEPGAVDTGTARTPG